MYQYVPLLAGFTTGDIAWLRVRRRDADDDKGKVTLQARNAAEAVLVLWHTTSENMGDTDWHERDVYLEIPANTDHFRIIFEGTRVTGTPLASAWDDVSLILFDKS